MHDLGLALWRDHVMRAAAIKPRVRAAVLGAINRERAGDQINQSLAGCCGCAGCTRVDLAWSQGLFALETEVSI